MVGASGVWPVEEVMKGWEFWGVLGVGRGSGGRDDC